MSREKKIKLKKRSDQSIKIRKGLAMPVGRVGENNAVSFRDWQDLKAKYYKFYGRVQRRPFVLRTLVLVFAQILFSLILYSKFVESLIIGRPELAAVFAIIFIALTIPVVLAEISLGIRRCHDFNKSGALFIVPYICYIGSLVAPVLGLHNLEILVQSITAVSYLALFTIKGNSGDNAYGAEHAR